MKRCNGKRWHRIRIRRDRRGIVFACFRCGRLWV